MQFIRSFRKKFRITEMLSLFCFCLKILLQLYEMNLSAKSVWQQLKIIKSNSVGCDNWISAWNKFCTLKIFDSPPSVRWPSCIVFCLLARPAWYRISFLNWPNQRKLQVTYSRFICFKIAVIFTGSFQAALFFADSGRKKAFNQLKAVISAEVRKKKRIAWKEPVKRTASWRHVKRLIVYHCWVIALLALVLVKWMGCVNVLTYTEF